MSLQQGLHDIYEKLPETTEDGFCEVREVIRHLFQSSPLDEQGRPLFGSPDNIRKAGCLALAQKGMPLWNAWRKAFPVSPSGENAVDFSGHHFAEAGNFHGFDFGDFANFSHSIFSGKFILFNSSKFGSHCNFSGARFGDGCSFYKTIFGNSTRFIGCQFGLNASFHEAEFKGDVIFLGAQFGSNAQFCKVLFQGWVNFAASSWEQLTEIVGWSQEQLMLAQKFSRRLNVSPDSFNKIDFRGAQFLGASFNNGETSVDFSNRKFCAGLDFSSLDGSPVRFASVPKFHGCEMNEDTSFEDARFPTATGNPKATRAYQALKLAFSKQQAIREEQRFFRWEMEEETLRETGLKRWLFRAYKTFSYYGFSITRPLKYGSLGVLALTLLYDLLSWAGQCSFSVEAKCAFAPQWIEFGLLQTLPLPGLDKLSESASKAFWPKGAWWELALSVLVIIHKTLSLATLFLIGLALRNLFKLK